LHAESATHATQAIEEVSKDPQAWLKYQNDPEVKSYFAKMMGLFGKQFEEHEKKHGREVPTAAGVGAGASVGGGGGGDGSGGAGVAKPIEEIEEIFTSGALKTSANTLKKGMIQGV